MRWRLDLVNSFAEEERASRWETLNKGEGGLQFYGAMSEGDQGKAGQNVFFYPSGLAMFKLR